MTISADDRNNSFYAVLDAKTEEERKVLQMQRFQEAVRNKIKSKGGMITFEDAAKEVNQEAIAAFGEVLEMIASSNPEAFAAMLRSGAGDLPVSEHIKAISDAIDEAMARHLTRMQNMDPKNGLQMMKNAFHHDNPEEFDFIVKRLKAKGLLLSL
jgi:hypothetical protein